MPFTSWRWFTALMLTLLVASTSAQAANTPCSGRKGGIAGCDGEVFLCNDGSISASKKSCSAWFGGSSVARPLASPQPATRDGCACGSGSYCTGPRGGVYCLTPAGNKSYRRR